MYRGRGGKGRKGQEIVSSKRKFDPDNNVNVKYTRLGVWDFYQELNTEIPRLPGSSRVEAFLETWLEMSQSMPYVWRMAKDIASLKSCWALFIFYVVVEVLSSLVPAMTLWYSGQLLRIVEIAVDQRTVDKTFLFHIAAGRVGCHVATRILSYFKSRITVPLNRRIKHHYSSHIFGAMARLDVPAFNDTSVQRQLEAATSSSGRSSVAWDTVTTCMGLVTAVIRLFSQLGVLVSVLRDQRDGPLLAALSFVEAIVKYFSDWRGPLGRSSIWAATTKNEDYIRSQGLKHVVDNPVHRQEVVAGNLANHLTSEYREAAARVADDAGDFNELRRDWMIRDRLSIASLLKQPLKELPQIAFTLRAAQHPASIPLSLASLTLIQSTASSFSFMLFQLFEQTGSISEQLSKVRKLYNVVNIPIRVPDGSQPFPEDTATLDRGIEVEFRRVSFRYPGADRDALQDVSFKILPGQLCVIVGTNGSGKSTILKLMLRIYDPTEGEIFLDGKNIRSLRLADLRQAVSVLFQDYTHFPLSISENIGLGDPAHSRDQDMIREAARLGGAESFVDRLPEGFNTYLDRPVRDYYSSLPEGTKTLFGRPVDYGRVRNAGGMESSSSTSLSGGQMQRLAVSRTFMRSVVSEQNVGLLLFDEPSASLDPAAEHDLFIRLRTLRGSKTMLFSSHRFGQLTRHADLILYMNDAKILEEGTHDTLIQNGGHYADIWNLQAQAFLS